MQQRGSSVVGKAGTAAGMAFAAAAIVLLAGCGLKGPLVAAAPAASAASAVSAAASR